jgi:hypothetical protein
VAITPTRDRNDHYVPQIRLRSFSHPGSGQLWVFRIGGRRWRRCGTRKIAAARAFYDFSRTVPASVSLDSEFQPLETAFARSLQRIRKSRGQNWSSDRDTLLRFAALQSVRTPRFISDAAAACRRQTDSSQLPDPERDHALALMPIEMQSRFTRWRSSRWALGQTRSVADCLITGDSPLFMVRFRDAEVLFFPLSWDLCLLGASSIPEGEWLDLPRNALAEIRGRVAQESTFFMASPISWGEQA